MNIALPELLAALRRTLHESVRPEVTGPYAIGQLASVEDILGKLERMVAWSPEAHELQARALRDGCMAFVASAAQEGIVLPPLSSAAGTPEQDLRAAEADVMRLTDWLFDTPATLGDAARAALDALLLQALRCQLVIERQRIPLTDFGAMTAGASASRDA
jgi:hypothetical protein